MLDCNQYSLCIIHEYWNLKPESLDLAIAKTYHKAKIECIEKMAAYSTI